MENRNLPKFDRLLTAEDVKQLIESTRCEYRPYDVDFEVIIQGELLADVLHSSLDVGGLIFLEENLRANNKAALEMHKERTDYVTFNVRYYAEDENDPFCCGMHFYDKSGKRYMCTEYFGQRFYMIEAEFMIFSKEGMKTLLTEIDEKIALEWKHGPNFPA